jgi:hypothetical protein
MVYMQLGCRRALVCDYKYLSAIAILWVCGAISNRIPGNGGEFAIDLQLLRHFFAFTKCLTALVGAIII